MNFSNYLEKNEKWHIWMVLIFATLLSCWRLGTQPVYEWDEARYGEIAFWMNERGDYINYQYAGVPDKWNAKPPLSVWLIAGSYKLFGHNEWALRLPSALAAIAFFALFYGFVSLYQSSVFATACCLILMTCKGVIGHHVGRTGDTDALLLVFLMAFLYAMALYLDAERPGAIIVAGLSLGLAFYAKGTTFMFYLPGVFIYLLFRKKLLPLLLDYRFWIAFSLVLIAIGSWYIAVTRFGQSFENEAYVGKNSWEVMILYDTIRRFTTTGVEGNPEAGVDYGFVFAALDIKFNLWNYVFYLGVLTGALIYWKRLSATLIRIQSSGFRLLLWSALLFASIGLVLTISKSKFVWYITPVLPFVAIWTVWFIFRSIRWRPVMAYAWIGLCLFTMSRQVVELHHIEESRGHLLKKHRTTIEQANQVWMYGAIPQDVRLYADWFNPSIVNLEDWHNWESNLLPGHVLIAKLSPEEKEEMLLNPELSCLSKGNISIIWHKNEQMSWLLYPKVMKARPRHEEIAIKPSHCLGIRQIYSSSSSKSVISARNARAFSRPSSGNLPTNHTISGVIARVPIVKYTSTFGKRNRSIPSRPFAETSSSKNPKTGI